MQHEKGRSRPLGLFAHPFLLTAVVSLQLGGGVDGHLAQGAVEETYRLLFFSFSLWSRLSVL